MTKVDIISGFLGAGKTTFIKKLIEEVFPGEKLVLIENEFGSPCGKPPCCRLWQSLPEIRFKSGYD